MFNGIRLAGSDENWEKDYEEQLNRAKGGNLPNNPLSSGVINREALGQDNGPVNSFVLTDEDDFDHESTNRGGGI